MKSLINECIEHKKYGRGIIIDEEAGKITVEFAKPIGNKMFQFPDAVEQYLKFAESSLQEESLLLFESKKQMIAEENERRKLEQKRLEEERLLEEMEQKKKYKQTAKSRAASAVKKTVNKSSQPEELDE
jgi:hypothetical protein